MADPPSHEEQIFNTALQFATREERAAYLKGACAGDAALRQRVDALLQAHEPAGNSPDPDATATSSPSSDLSLVELVTEKPGDLIGRYKLLQQIGEGGCGVVYMAEQEEPVRRRVALKVIKLGMDTRQVIARFEAERQALALMDHPNIAKVLDAGATEAGRPYFVMELVRGIKITEYCDQNNLSTNERLQLFIEICRAIQHAHQKGIIHRDIKPSNILVTLHDGAPVPKVIDFGIAKATTGQRLTDKTLFTAFEQFIGTPAYMSPEQAEMSGLDIDTRSDIYALGVLLYELLTGKTPFDAKRLVEAGIDEIRRIIREEEPPRPSTRISTLIASEQTTVARCRGAEAPKLIHAVRGDLDWIVMKAMEKDRTRRYETANGLAMDITRFLDNEPIVARPPSNFYRFQKLARRNKLAFAAVAAVATALVLGAGVSTWQAVRATRAEREQSVLRANESQLRKQAETEAALAKQSQIEAEQRLAESLLAQGDALCGKGVWDQARDRYQEAETVFQKLGLSTFPARLAVWSTHRHSPLPLNSLVARTAATNDATRLPDAVRPLPIGDVRFLPDGIHALSIGTDQVIKEWDCELGMASRTVDIKPLVATCTAISSDGRRVLMGGETGELTLWDREGGRPLRTWSGHRARVDSVAISPDGRVCTSGGHDGSIQCWDVATGGKVGSLTGHERAVKCLTISSDDRLVLSGSEDGTARVWDMASGKLLQTFSGHGDWVFAVAFSPDGKYALSGSGDFRQKGAILVLWEVETGSVYRTFEGHTAGISSVAFSPDGRHILSGSWDGDVMLWDIAAGRNLDRFCGHHDRVCRVAFSPDGHRALSAGENGIVQVWSVENSGDLRTFTGLSADLEAVAISPDGRLALAGDLNGDNSREMLWDVSTGHELCSWKHDANVKSVALSRDGRLSLAGQEDGIIVLHDLATGRALHTLSGHVGSVASVDFSGDSSRFLSGGEDGTVRLWDVPQGVELRSATNGYPLRAVRFSPDNLSAIAAGKGPELMLWDLATGKNPVTLPTHQGEIKSVAWSADGRYLLSASDDKTVKLWDLETRREMRTDVHSDSIFAAVFGEKDQFAFSGQYFGGIYVWEVPTGRYVSTLQARAGTVTALAMSADGLSLLSGTHDHEVNLWDFSRVAGYAAFEPQLAEARRRLLADPTDLQALASFGDWYAFRGASEWAVDLLERARRGGASVSSLTLARGYWQMNDFDSARREFQHALERNEAPESYLRLCLAAVSKSIQGYRIDHDDVVFDFDPAVYDMSVAEGAEVQVAGEFNNWLDNDKGSITNSYPQWVMQRIDQNHYTLRRKIADFRERPQWQFKFVVDRNNWSEVPVSAQNRGELNGDANLVFTVPPLTTRTSLGQN
jgi:eukaryotic-like serine/threonine-protein kinase